MDTLAHLATALILIGCFLPQKRQGTQVFPLVIISGKITQLPMMAVGEPFGSVRIGTVALVRVVSTGLWIIRRLVGAVVCRGAWCS